MSLFKKLLIANRGEIAVRLIRACREMDIRAVAVYSEADANALHVRLADEAVLIGPPPPRESYLQIDRILEAAQKSKAEAIHPGYGFLSENADFAEAVTSAGLIFVGPPADAIRKMGSKTRARAIMQNAGVPVVPGYHGAADADFSEAAGTIGYPVLVKAAAGGGGKGMRIVKSPAELAESVAAAQREAANAFGSDEVFIEKYIDRPRHIEFQVLADSFGETVHLFERECSIQRRHQKIIEETPSPFLTSERRAKMGAAAVAAAKAAGYVNAGTVEFIVDDYGDFYFLEMNTRLQVEHPVTEMVTGVDLVKAQIRIAAGERLWFGQRDLSQRGHAVECRIYAEDPANNFYPSGGKIEQAVEPVRPGVRVDAGVTAGDEVSIYYDPLIAKVIAHAETRAGAIRKMDAALADYKLTGITTNISFLRAVLIHPAFERGETTTHFIEEHLKDWRAAPEIGDWRLDASRGGLKLEIRASADPWERADGFRLGMGSGGQLMMDGGQRAKRANVKRQTTRAGGHETLEAAMPGLVRGVLVKVGDSVERGQALVLLEAMKMEIRVSAPHAGKVAKVLVSPGETVDRGQRLIELSH
ncbi:MAG: acetyl-CoA carboxylase biotin carboxylase subunit [Chloroflexota bacterium]